MITFLSGPVKRLIVKILFYVVKLLWELLNGKKRRR